MLLFACIGLLIHLIFFSVFLERNRECIIAYLGSGKIIILVYDEGQFNVIQHDVCDGPFPIRACRADQSIMAVNNAAQLLILGTNNIYNMH